MNTHTIALVGGTGFIGQAVMHALARRGHQVKLLSRHAPTYVLPKNVIWHSANTAHPATLVPHLQGCQSVVHLVAMLAERGTPFTTTITQSAHNTALAAQQAKVPQFVYISALGASSTSPSRYARAKAQAEVYIRNLYPNAAIIQPSLVIGQGGGFRQQIEHLTRYLPVMVLPGWGQSRFQPVDVEKLATLIADHALSPTTSPVTVPAVGPHVVTFAQLARAELAHLNRRRILLPLPWSLTWAVAGLFKVADALTAYRLIPAWLLVTPDQVHLLQRDNILSPHI